MSAYNVVNTHVCITKVGGIGLKIEGLPKFRVVGSIPNTSMNKLINKSI